MNDCLATVSKQQPLYKFCKLRAATAGVSKQFVSGGDDMWYLRRSFGCQVGWKEAAFCESELWCLLGGGGGSVLPAKGRLDLWSVI